MNINENRKPNNLSEFKDDIKEAVKVMRAGGIILYPTDTIWGLGCDATNEDAVKKIYELKKRSDSKALLVLTDHVAKVERLVDEMPEVAYDLIDLSEKPLTIIYSGAKNLATNLLAEDGSVGIRVTKESFSKALCETFRLPIVSTSANISGEPAAKNFSEISEEIKNGVDYIVKYRQKDFSKAAPSSIIKLGKGGEVSIIRE
ncbi:MAG: threonylcarbamoyl-AMP synthase [Paludibacteraceae bacterium]|nr:threonylcarbamoyl-AMP synthase [Paludibacteraceae bacterium]MEE3484657.1 L-threonylcarbamoyladenylate synthase [Bacteroidales bacterium]